MTADTTVVPARELAQAPATTAELRAMLPLVQVRDLKVEYNAADGLVLDGVDLDLFPGELVALLGSSGSGKSTLMRTLTGFAPITSGTVRAAGYDVANLRRGELRSLRASAGQVFQQFNLIGRLSVLTNVLTGGLHHAGPYNLVGGFRSEQRKRALELLDRVGIAHKARDEARSLSGGQQQRVAIARALMQQPKLILADEPVASLDPKLSDSVLELLRSIAREDGIPVLVSLHVLPLALRHSDRIVGLQHGRMLVSAPTEGIDPRSLDMLYDGEDAGHDDDA
ncbi:ATP-binding cassette domain-containing protein [Salinibacterium sp. dk2585]|uniref:phosphonate ABC transporter ATP-binding protein n=1 Tax=unclassified Salinibacterium TaxID=2632331 RepID=UPI0011C24CC8|nr:MULTISPECIES: ATP-binding cassette domain-containing protein [unclassified Salinibacterium]QEE60568.1 ATP-binding cassette domain-containing protein [Salinibacterium sp. dk2585]TXK55640.1 ATP-binding cassette domain-containing protein [Salinibacterium sp. dk5596]